MRNVFGLATADFFADLAGEHRGQLAGIAYSSNRDFVSTFVQPLWWYSYSSRFLADSNLREGTRLATLHWLPALIIVLGVKMILREPRLGCRTPRGCGAFSVRRLLGPVVSPRRTFGPPAVSRWGRSRSEVGDLVSRPVGLGVAAAVSMLTAEGRGDMRSFSEFCRALSLTSRAKIVAKQIARLCYICVRARARLGV